MRTEVEIRGRLRALLVRELDQRIELASKRLPHLCKHNYRHPLDDREMIDGEPNYDYNRITLQPWTPVSRTLGLCLVGQESPEDWKGDICEDPIDAQRCPLFEPIRTKDEILTEFVRELETPGWAEDNLPGVAELLWVLEETSSPRIPWWKKFWYHWILRIRVEPPTKAASIDLLLTEGRGDEGVGT